MKTVLITGGSAGIGFEIAKKFAADNYRILLVAHIYDEIVRAAEALTTTYPAIEVAFLVVDLAESDGPRRVYEWVKEQGYAIDVVINNAGIGTYGFAHEQHLNKELGMLRLNILALFQLTRIFLDDMMARNAGTIINISSNSSLQAVPKMSAYAASKAFVSHYTEGLRQELAAQNSLVRIMTIIPAAIKDTQFKSAAKMEGVKTFEGLATTTKEEVAKDVWKGFQNGRQIVVSGSKMRLLYNISWLVPKAVSKYLVWKEVARK